MYDLRVLFLSGVLLALFWPAVEVLAAASAGKVVFAKGEVKAVDASGAGRYLIKNDPVFSGDTVTTGDGKVQIQFTDGGYASLKADTEYRLADYVYRGSADGSERSFFNLLKGSVRFVTGIIGKSNRKSFRISTKTATIGIRGSSGLAVSCVAGSCDEKADGTYLTTYAGILTLISGSFSGEVHPQETYFCDGLSCLQIEVEAAAPQSIQVLPDHDAGYRQGDQQSADPGGHSHGPSSPPAAPAQSAPGNYNPW